MARVLVVDDDPEIRDLLSVNLAASGHEVLDAQDGPSALELLASARPDVILLDVMMPTMDGFEVLEQLKKADASVASIPVVMVTGRTAPEDRFRGGVEGALVYVTKPFDLEVVIATIEQLLTDPRTERERRGIVQREALSSMAHYERTGTESPATGDVEGAVHLTRLEHSDSKVEGEAVSRVSLEGLTERQRMVVDALLAGRSVAAVAEDLEVSRSNVYATLQRIARVIGISNSEELLVMLRKGALR
ncbi:MAG: response regulator [Acidimicrobiia bacterium]